MNIPDVPAIVKAQLLESTDWPVTGVDVLHAHVRSYSKHFTLRANLEDGASHLVFVKFVQGITRDRSRLEQLVTRDNAITRFLEDAFQATPQFEIPRPICFSPEHLMLMTTFVEGTRLQDKIVRKARFLPSGQSLHELENDFLRCGQWLRAFQRETRRFFDTRPKMEGDDFFGIETINRIVIDRVEELHSENVLDADDYRRVIAYVESKAADLTPEMMATSGIHGDFFPGNMLVRDEAVTGIDFVMFRKGTIYFDPTYFVFQLETLGSQFGYRSSVIESVKRAFLRGYDPESVSGDIWNLNPLCHLLFVMHSTARLLTLANRLPTGIRKRFLTRRSLQSTRRLLLDHVRNSSSADGRAP